MSITIEINSSLEAILRQKALIEGLSIEDYVLRLAEQDLLPGLPSDVLFDEAIRKLEAFRGKLGPVPEGALNPDLLYGDR